MSCIAKLVETYDNNINNIGNKNDRIPLLPVAHTTNQSQIEIILDGDGNFLKANVVDKKDSRTIIPCTEDSAGRTRGPSPHPLCDKLQYIACDYVKYGGEKEPQYELYKNLLSKWLNFDNLNQKLKSIFTYVSKGTVIKDLVNYGILYVDSSNGDANPKLILKLDSKDMPDNKQIFKVLNPNQRQSDVFVRWIVEIPGVLQSEVWNDRTMWDSWKKYYLSDESENGFCQITGAKCKIATNHPAKIRHDGDKAKLISSNDEDGFTFRGERAKTPYDACSIGYETSQKFHSALRWLLNRQGNQKLGFVAWAVSGSNIPDPFKDAYDICVSLYDEKYVDSYTAQDTGIGLSKLIAGYYAKIKEINGNIIIMGIDSIVPGRMSKKFYKEYEASEFLKNILQWHNECSWLQKVKKYKNFIGAPSPKDIVETAYGERVKDKLFKATIERILPCIAEQAQIPMDIVNSCIRRAVNIYGITKEEWEKHLGVACALYKYQNKERKYAMSLECERKTRDYLYGRALACAERIESWALYISKQERQTNAMRYMQRFSTKPYSTWLIIEKSLIPYKRRLGKRIYKLEKTIDDIMNSFDTKDFISDAPLSGEFLLGYHAQRADFFKKQEDSKDDKTEKENDEN